VSQEVLRGVYAQLSRAVERRDWAQALRLVDLLRQQLQDPAQLQKLEGYRRQLESYRQVQGDPPPPQWPLLHKPFIGDFPVTNLFDHDLPLGEGDGNGRFVSGQGQVWTPSPQHPCGKSDGHAGYDWAMPVGTPILAAAPGRVTVARPEPEFFCPSLGRPVRGLRVRILHEGESPGGIRLETLYAHLSQIRVHEGQRVAAGEVIGLSGKAAVPAGPISTLRCAALTKPIPASPPLSIPTGGLGLAWIPGASIPWEQRACFFGRWAKPPA
jgi:murein DD-endopeptidase MepM/ murein hydrolase activator NlpD